MRSYRDFYNFLIFYFNENMYKGNGKKKQLYFKTSKYVLHIQGNLWSHFQKKNIKETNKDLIQVKTF